MTVHAIQPGRGSPEATTLRGEDFAGVIVRDGRTPYRRFMLSIRRVSRIYSDAVGRCRPTIRAQSSSNLLTPRSGTCAHRHATDCAKTHNFSVVLSPAIQSIPSRNLSVN
jgi:hypothetical protein